jgi:hypothetical protein
VKRKRGNTQLTVILAGLILVVAGVLAAQDKPADNMQFVLEKARADKKLLVAQNMQLSDSEAKAFWPVYNRYQDELFLLRTRTVKLIKDYVASYDTMNDATANRLLDEYLTIEKLRLKLRIEYLPKFRNVLPSVKVMRYYQLENKINVAIDYELAAAIPLIATNAK